MEEGGRSQGWGGVTGGGVTVTLGIKDFWQSHPKAISIDAQKQELTAYLYSPHGDELDLRRYSHYTYSELYETSRSGPEPAEIGPEGDWEGRLTPDDLGARHIGKTSEFFVDIAANAEPGHSSREAIFFQSPPILARHARMDREDTRVWRFRSRSSRSARRPCRPPSGDGRLPDSRTGLSQVVFISGLRRHGAQLRCGARYLASRRGRLRLE